MGVLIASLIISYCLSIGYTLWLNPEVRFWKEAYKQKLSWATKVSESGAHKLVFIGGSSSAFQIDAGALTASGIPSVNMGMHAGMGSIAIAACGLKAVRAGDTVVWGFEPDRLTKPPELTPLGCQILVATGIAFNPGMGKIPLRGVRWFDFITSLRPGLQHSITMMAKLVAHRPSYRYETKFLIPGGGLFTDVRMAVTPNPPTYTQPNIATLLWLQNMNSDLRLSGCKSAYLMPQGYYLAKDRSAARQSNQRFLQLIDTVVPVILDPVLGVQTNADYFADTPLHLTYAGMQLRTLGLHSLLDSELKGH